MAAGRISGDVTGAGPEKRAPDGGLLRRGSDFLVRGLVKGGFFAGEGKVRKEKREGGGGGCGGEGGEVGVNSGGRGRGGGVLSLCMAVVV